MRLFVEQTVNGLSLGSIYALIALGLAVVFSILRLINFAHGELLTVAGYVTFTLSTRGVSWAAIIPLAILASMAAALAMERLVFRPLRRAKPLTLLVVSMAVSLVLQNVFLLFIGARPKPLDYPGWVGDHFLIGSIRIQWLDVVTFGTLIVALVLLNLFLRRSVTGLAMRAAATDPGTTRLMGVRADFIFLGAFAVSGALAGLAAIFYFAAAPVVTPTSGFFPLLKGFIASVIGGLGSLSGAVLGGFLLGFLEVYLEGYLPGNLTGATDAFVFGILITVLLFRPTGLLGIRGLEARV